MINVTEPFLPPKEEFDELIAGIWERKWLTNNGPLVNALEAKLSDHLGIKNIVFVGNGTVALQIAIRALGLSKEIITTPFSYVATTTSILWERCQPVYVDIEPLTLNIDPNKIEAAITSKTEAILATHCFGNPCDIDAIETIARKYNLKVIYDAAHCFGTTYKGRSLFDYGDISTASFHATKIYHSIEGGAVFSHDNSLNRRISHMRNFGHAGPEKFDGIGINGKNSEFHAAMGIVNLRYIDSILARRKEQSKNYDMLLEGMQIEHQQIASNSEYNYSYYPIILESEEVTLEIKEALEAKAIYSRRYFYPSLNKLEYSHGDAPISVDISSRILCLPLYYDLTIKDQELVANILKERQR
ncbi:MAG: DegT/DnrJ/EryC1/StrS family aminotransferase [Cyclobacteriaceae bacterium]